MKRCLFCRAWKTLDHFHRNRAKRDGLQNRCRDCNIALNKQWYADHTDQCLERMAITNARLERRNQQQLLAYLREHPCRDCGERDPVVLEFDHLRDKHANVSALVHAKAAWARILAEIAKCDVVCANCHRRRTARRLNSFRWRKGLPEPVV